MTDLKHIDNDTLDKRNIGMPGWAQKDSTIDFKLEENPEWIYNDTYQAAIRSEPALSPTLGKYVMVYTIYIRKKLNYDHPEYPGASSWIRLLPSDGPDSINDTIIRRIHAITKVKTFLLTGSIENWYEMCMNNPESTEAE